MIPAERLSALGSAVVRQPGHSIPDPVGDFFLVQERHLFLRAIAVQQGDSVGADAKAGFRSPNIIDHNQIKILFLEFSRPLLEMIPALRGKADE